MLRRVSCQIVSPSAVAAIATFAAAPTAVGSGVARWCHNGAPPRDHFQPLISGDATRSVRNASNSVITCTDFVGSSVAGPLCRLAGGEMLGLMDITAARTAMLHVTGQKTPVNRDSGGNVVPAPAATAATSSTATSAPVSVSVATIGTDNASFLAPVLHGDVVEMTGKVIHAGSSSIGVLIQAYRLPFASDGKSLVAEAYFSMVAIDKQLKAAKVVPAVLLESREDILRHQEYKEIRAAQVRSAAYFHELERGEHAIDKDVLADAVNTKGTTRVPMRSTITEANRLFFSGHLNMNNTIFGGEILRWMEAHATYCGRKFTKNRFVHSIGMHSVSFNNPIFITDWVSLRARVVLNCNATLEVDVKLTVEREGCPVMTNRASFVLINTDELGQKCRLTTGISLDGEDERSVRHVAMALKRYRCGKLFHDEKKRKIAAAAAAAAAAVASPAAVPPESH